MTSEISYRLATVDDHDELSVLLTKNFQHGEPFNRYWVNNDPVPEDIEWSLKLLVEGTSFIAVDNVRSIIVGACLTGVDEASTTQNTLDEANKTTHKKWAQYLRLYARVDMNANIFGRFNVEKIFHVSALAVNDGYRERSIATKLVEKSFELATSQGYKLCSIYCSSFYTERIAQKLKMEFVGEIAMDEIKDEKGERLTFPPPPHSHIRTYVKQLPAMINRV